MVKAILAGTKTQTRRVVKPQPPEWVKVWNGCNGLEHFFFDREEDDEGGKHWPSYEQGLRCPYGQPGDRLRVKEAAWMWCERRPNGKTPTGRDKWLYVPLRSAPVIYAADHPAKPGTSVVSPDTGNQWGWRLKIGRFLPAWASRITLEVTGVRVERLQDISEADAKAEGCVVWPECKEPAAINLYRALWDQINGPGSWDANPWVWVVEFKRIKP